MVVCSSCSEGIYVTRLCEGRPERDSGKVGREEGGGEGERREGHQMHAAQLYGI